MKKVLSFVLVFALVLGCFAGLQVTSAALPASGKCGPNVNYSFNSATGQLTISGTGDMYSYDYDPAEGVTDHSPFYNAAEIKSIVIQEGVTNVGRMMFEKCTGLTSVQFSQTVTEIDDIAFYNCSGLMSITIPDNVTSLGEAAFGGCTALRSCVLSKNLTGIYADTFRGCENLESINIPNKATMISDSAFENCKKLASILIPDSVTHLGHRAFAGSGIKEIVIPATVTSIQNYLFRGCESLTCITVDAANPSYDSRNNCNAIIRSDTDTLICACKKTVIPDTVEVIDGGAFYGIESVGSVAIPDSVKTIEWDAFEGTGYYNNKANWKNGLLYMDNWLVACDFSVKNDNVVLKSGTRGIAEYTFWNGATGQGYPLKSITVPLSLKYVNAMAFDRCNALKDVYYYGSPAQWKQIEVDWVNEALTGAKIHYYHNAKKLMVFQCTARTVAAQKVEWNRVSGATGYQVQISNAAGNKWATLYNISKGSTTSCVFKNLAAGTNYKFRLRCVSKDAKGKAVVSAWKYLASPTLPKGTALTKLVGGNKCFSAQWKKAAVTGYQIQYATNAKFTGAKLVTIKNAKTYQTIVKKLTAKKVYCVRIRTYKTIAKVNYFSAWSKTYKVKTK